MGTNNLLWIYIRWRQGQALGTSNDGIVNPIMAVVRRNKLGLGL